MKTSRQRVLDYIQTHRAATAAEISQALNMTTANARHHLGILFERGTIEIIGQQSKEGKGRPAQIFALADHSNDHNLAQLCSALIAEMEHLTSVEDRMGSMERISRRLFPAASTPRGPRQHLTRRLHDAVQQLNRSNYRARWEAHIDAPRLILGHCPYKAIIEQHPEICQIDALILKALLEEPVDQIAKLLPDGRGIPNCIFQVGYGR